MLRALTEQFCCKKTKDNDSKKSCWACFIWGDFRIFAYQFFCEVVFLTYIMRHEAIDLGFLPRAFLALVWISFALASQVLFVMLKMTTPRVLASGEQEMKSLLVDESASEERGYYCKHCQEWRPQRVGHCEELGVCVWRYDQYCSWTGVCVDIGNHRLYMAWLTSFFTQMFGATFSVPMYLLACKTYDAYFNTHDASAEAIVTSPTTVATATAPEYVGMWEANEALFPLNVIMFIGGFFRLFNSFVVVSNVVMEGDGLALIAIVTCGVIVMYKIVGNKLLLNLLNVERNITENEFVNHKDYCYIDRRFRPLYNWYQSGPIINWTLFITGYEEEKSQWTSKQGRPLPARVQNQLPDYDDCDGMSFHGGQIKEWIKNSRWKERHLAGDHDVDFDSFVNVTESEESQAQKRLPLADEVSLTDPDLYDGGAYCVELPPGEAYLIPVDFSREDAIDMKAWFKVFSHRLYQ